MSVSNTVGKAPINNTLGDLPLFFEAKKVCERIFSLILYPLRLIAKLFEKPSPLSTPLSPHSSTPFIRFVQQIKAHKREILCLTTLGSFLGLYFYEDVAACQEPSHLIPLKTILMIGSIVLAGSYAAYRLRVPNSPDVKPGSSMLENLEKEIADILRKCTPPTVNVQPVPSVTSLLDLLEEIKYVHTYNYLFSKKYEEKRFEEIDGRVKEEVLSEWNIDRYKNDLQALCTSSNAFIVSIKDRIENLEEKISSEEFALHQPKYLQLLFHLQAIEQYKEASFYFLENFAQKPSLVNEQKDKKEGLLWKNFLRYAVYRYTESFIDKKYNRVKICRIYEKIKQETPSTYVDSLIKYQRSIKCLQEELSKEFTLPIKNCLEYLAKNLSSKEFVTNYETYQNIFYQLQTVLVYQQNPMGIVN